jgi:ribosomal protein L12E/L44/L45/RPP1/RPP2
VVFQREKATVVGVMLLKNVSIVAGEGDRDEEEEEEEEEEESKDGAEESDENRAFACTG